MLRNEKVAVRYADSFYESIKEAGHVDLSFQQLLEFHNAVHKDEELKKFFLNPSISKSEKVEVLKSLSDKMKDTYRFLVLLVEAARFPLLEQIIDLVEKRIKEDSGVVKVELFVANRPSDKLLQSISDLIESKWRKKPDFEIKESKSILGGFIAKAPGQTLDASVRTQLQFMESKLAS